MSLSQCLRFSQRRSRCRQADKTECCCQTGPCQSAPSCFDFPSSHRWPKQLSPQSPHPLGEGNSVSGQDNSGQTPALNYGPPGRFNQGNLPNRSLLHRWAICARWAHPVSCLGEFDLSTQRLHPSAQRQSGKLWRDAPSSNDAYLERLLSVLGFWVGVACRLSRPAAKLTQ